MPIDPYTPCPGGTGKKIKFCCSDLLGELDKIQHMLEGDQRAACLEHIEALEGKHPQRACLMSIKAMLQAQLGHEEAADKTLADFMAKYPDNPVALAEKATLVASKQGGAPAIGVLQDALEKCAEQIPPQVYDAIGVVAQMLIADHQLLPARAHLVLQLSIGGTQDERPLQLMMRLNSSPTIPLVAKQDLPLLPAPDDALWKKAFTEAMEPAMRGAWRQAAKNLAALVDRVGGWPEIWHNLAVLRTWLADASGAVEAWRQYAAQKIPLDDAVEAEALAQWLDVEAIDQVDVLTVTYQVLDVEALQARLAAHKRSQSMPIDLARMAGEDEPPPRGAYWLLDRAVPESGKDIKIDEAPRVVGQAFLFGKQTDRPARLELVVYRPDQADAASALAEVAGDAIGPATGEEVTTHVPALEHLLSRNWRLPYDTPAACRFELVRQQRAKMLLEDWPKMPMRAFGGKSPTDVAGDPAYRVKLLAAILLLEASSDPLASSFDFNTLRANLGFSTRDPIDPTKVELNELPLARLVRVDVAKLSIEQLLDLYRRAEHYRHVPAVRRFASELLARRDLPKDVDKAQLYGALAQIEPDGGRAIEYLDQARKASEEINKSTAPWDLAELSLRLVQGEVAEADRLLHHIRDEHIREPGVAQALFQLLAEAGIIGPDGRPRAAAPAEAPGIVVPGAAAAEPGKIWTPGSEQPSTGKKSALWTPGME